MPPHAINIDPIAQAKIIVVKAIDCDKLFVCTIGRRIIINNNGTPAPNANNIIYVFS